MSWLHVAGDVALGLLLVGQELLLRREQRRVAELLKLLRTANIELQASTRVLKETSRLVEALAPPHRGNA